MKIDLGGITNRALVELAHRAHGIVLFSEYLRIKEGLDMLGAFARSRLCNPYELEPRTYTATRQYLDKLAEYLLSLIPPQLSEQGLRKAQEEARYYGLPKVNGNYPRLASSRI